MYIFKLEQINSKLIAEELNIEAQVEYQIYKILSMTLYYLSKSYYYDMMRFFQADSTSHHVRTVTRWC